jgi:hypothetical protein
VKLFIFVNNPFLKNPILNVVDFELPCNGVVIPLLRAGVSATVRLMSLQIMTYHKLHSARAVGGTTIVVELSVVRVEVLLDGGSDLVTMTVLNTVTGGSGLGLLVGRVVVMTVVENAVEPAGGVTVTTEVLPPLLVPLFWTDEVLVAVRVAGVVPALGPVGSAPLTMYTELPTDHHAASSMV